MADVTITIDKKNIADFLSGIKNNKFIIPDYQRDYAWDIDECETLWNDIVHAYRYGKGEDYFLGSIVSCKDESGDLKIIDGQQRITTLTLLLRAFYEQIIGDVDHKEAVKELKGSIEKCIWKKDKISGEINIDNMHLESKVATDEHKEVLKEIIKTGAYNNGDNKKIGYYDNYEKLSDKCKTYAASHPTKWMDLCLFVLDQCIILPIQCNNEDTALTIFQTLNDRGLSLSNADIFKARIYGSKTSKKEKADFIDDWTDLLAICEDADIGMDDLFTYYSHVLRAEDDITGSEISIRKFYSDDSWSRLKIKSLIPDLICLAKFWCYVKCGPTKESLGYTISENTKKWFQCLDHYPNQRWKNVTSVFFYYRNQKKDFKKQLEDFTKQLVCFLCLRYLIGESIDAIKDYMFQAGVAIKENKHKFKVVKVEEFDRKLQYHRKGILRVVLLIHAYSIKEQELINTKPKLHVEHILPKKWQNTNYRGWSREDADEYVEILGNKVICESKINIQAGNGYFGEKKEHHYKDSKILQVKQLANHAQNDWLKKDIVQRQRQVTNDLREFFGPLLEEIPHQDEGS